MNVIPSNQHEKFTIIENFFNGHSYSGIDASAASHEMVF